MRVLILTCNTGGGHNAVAAALRDSLQRCGASCDVMDGLGFISKKASKFVSKWHTRFYRRYPKLYKAGYMSAEGDKEMDRRDGPVYRYIARGARRLGRTLQSGGYDAVVCVHVIPAMMMTALKQAWSACPVFCFVATDYTCSPTVGACTPDICVIPHQELADEFVSCGIAAIPFCPPASPCVPPSASAVTGPRRGEPWACPETGRHIVLMSGSIGCGPMGDVAEDLDMRMADGDFATVLCGSNKQMRYALELRRLYRVEAVGFTTQVQLYMDSADVLVSKPGGISITEAGTRGVPLLLADMVGGCETRNEAFFTAHGLGGLLPAGQHGRVGPGLSGGRTAASGHHRCPEPRFRRPGRRPCGRRRPRPLQEMTPAPTAAAVGAFFALFVRRPSCISRKLSVYLLKKYRFVHRQVIFV